MTIHIFYIKVAQRAEEKIMFTILKKDARSQARIGLLQTKHGVVETPSYVIVGTHAKVRALTSNDLTATKTQIIIANTYHMWQSLGSSLLTYKGLHQHMRWDGTIMTDSGGFQIFSLGFGREHGIGKISAHISALPLHQAEKNSVRITEDGVYFTTQEGKELYLDAEISIAIQEQLGADIIVAFDECTSPLHDYQYNREAMERTHRWAKRSIRAKTRSDQIVYGVIQGGIFEDLRRESARVIAEMSFDGFAIGGSFGETAGQTRGDMFDVLDWTIPLLDDQKPRHLLGIGKVEDLFGSIERGVDTFDCVIPTREGRHGAIWTRHGRVDIKKGCYQDDQSPLEFGCACDVCTNMKTTRSQLYRLFRKVESSNGSWTYNPEGGHLASIHNVYFFNNLMAQIRNAIKEDRFLEFKQEFLAKFNRS